MSRTGTAARLAGPAATCVAPAAECFTIRNRQTAESVLVFDRLSFVPPNEP